MKKYNYIAVFALIFMSTISWCVDTKKGEQLLQKAVQDEYLKTIKIMQGTHVFNWKKIFNLIDQYSIKPALLRFKVGTQAISLLQLAIDINRLDPDLDNSEMQDQQSFNAIKTLLEKYHVFKQKPCGIDNCDQLIAIALQSDKWAMGEGYSNEALVDLLLKHGAKPNQKTIKDIKKVYDYLPQEEKGKYKHIQALLKVK